MNQVELIGFTPTGREKALLDYAVPAVLHVKCEYLLTIDHAGLKHPLGAMSRQCQCPFLALSGCATRADECLLLGAERTWTNRCLQLDLCWLS